MSNLLKVYLKKLKDADAETLNFYSIKSGVIEVQPFIDLNLVLPKDLQDFWSVVKGVENETNTTVEKTWLDGTFTYFSAEESLIDYNVWQDVCEQNLEMKDWYMPSGFLPIGSPGEGSRILVNCRKSSPTHGHVYELFHGIGLTKLSENLSQYFRTLILAFNHGLSVKDGYVNVDESQFNKIAAMMNPGCSGWYDIPQTQDWLSKA